MVRVRVRVRDVRAHDERGCEHGGEVGSHVVVVEGVVVGQEEAPVEEATLGELAPADDDACVGRVAELGPHLVRVRVRVRVRGRGRGRGRIRVRVSELGPHLGDVTRAHLHVAQRILRGLHRGHVELARALERVLGARLIEDVARALEVELE